MKNTKRGRSKAANTETGTAATTRGRNPKQLAQQADAVGGTDTSGTLNKREIRSLGAQFNRQLASLAVQFAPLKKMGADVEWIGSPTAA